jgi:hypothetical protein
MYIVSGKKNEAKYIVVPFVGIAAPQTFKTSAASIVDSAYYKDGAGAWTSLAITDTFSEIGSTGVYAIDLTAGEMNHDLIMIKANATDVADTCIIVDTTGVMLKGTTHTSAVVPTVTTLTGHTAQTGDNYARIGATGSGLTSLAQASVATEARLSELDAATGGKMANQVDEIRTDTEDIQGRLPAALVSGRMSSDAVAISGDTTAADNLELITELSRGVRTGFYQDSAVWLDTVVGYSGTTDYVNGVPDYPADTLANAKTIADSIGLTRFRICGQGNVVTLAAVNYAGYTFAGEKYKIDLAAAIGINGCYIKGANAFDAAGGGVVGGATSQSSVLFEDCNLGDMTAGNDNVFLRCGLGGGSGGDTVTCVAGNIHFHECYQSDNNVTPILDFGVAVANTTVNFGYNGAFEVQNMGQLGTDVLVLMGRGRLTVNANCTGGTIYVFGQWEITDNGSATINYADEQDVTVTVASVGAIADAVLTESVDDHKATANSLAEHIDAIQVDTDDLQTNQGNWLTATGFALATVCTEARLAELDAANMPTDLTNIEADTQDLQTQIGTAGAGLTDLGGMSAAMKTEVEDTVWDATMASHLDVGSTGEKLNAAGAAGDPWTTALPGAYGAGTAGYILGTNLDAVLTARTKPAADYFDWTTDHVANVTTVATLAGHTAQTGDSFARLGAPAGASVSADIADIPTVAEFNARTLVAASYFDPAADTVANVTTVGSVTGNVGGNVTGNLGGTLTSTERDAIADALLNRNMATGTDDQDRTPRNALRTLVNKRAISGTTLTVYAEDDSTTAWTATITTAAVNPVTQVASITHP